MVGTPSQCHCDTTYTVSDNDYVTGTVSSSCSCGCCQTYEYVISSYDAVIAAIEDIVALKNIPKQWEIIRTVFFVILILRHYVECKARAPPLLALQNH